MKWVILLLVLSVSLIDAEPAPPKLITTDEKPSPKKAQVAEDFSRLLNAEETGCYTDSDCGNSEFCDENGMCENSDSICYGDDDCRGKMVCDMGNFICVNPTPSPVTPSPTDPAGCCYGDSYKANDKCTKAMEANKCVVNGCSWRITDGPTDCVITTTETPTTTVEPGCCGSDNAKKFEMCNTKDTRDSCMRSGGCGWISGSDAVCEPQQTTAAPGCCAGDSYVGSSKCLMAGDASTCARISNCGWIETDEPEDCVLTTTTVAPGCCYGDSYKANGKCTMASEQEQCESKDCKWRETDDPNDCVITTTETPTTTEQPGCCGSDKASKFDMCNVKDSQNMCERSSSCHWVPGADAVCEPPTETTVSAGCCFGNPNNGYSKRWMDKCTEYYTERDCLLLTGDDGSTRCAWEDLGENYDCAMLWPTTTTSSTTEEPGCCMGDSSKTNDKCNMKEGRDICSRSSSCHFLPGANADCSWSATTTEQPGCCYGNPDAAYSKRWMDSCTAFYSERDCLMLTDDAGAYRCAWESKSVNYDCSQLWPTTTTTTEAAGCCRGSSYKAQAKCVGLEDQVGCERKDCEWVETYDESDCELTTTSEPWMGAKPGAEHFLPKPKPKDAQTQLKSKNAADKSEALLFGGGDTVVGQAMNTQVSLSSVLMLAMAAFAVYQMYRRCATSAKDEMEYRPIGRTSSTYQTA